ncbi:MAG: Arc family DNA-binding protein [Pseudomonadota bacterium]|nr:Arc family DNA-binding protein [Pseudomonadota bacterium]
MRQIVIRKLDDAVLAKIKARARINHRSAEAEIRAILSDAVLPKESKHKALASLIGVAQVGRTQKDIDAYVRNLRDEWDR